MRKTIAIIACVALLGILSYGLHQTGGPQGLVQPKKTLAGSSVSATSPTGGSVSYKDGTFTGSAEYMPYGTVQIAAVISGGKIKNIKYLQMPSGLGHTNQVTYVAEPLLKQTTLSAQSANIDFVSGATLTSESYQASLQSALDQAATSGSSGSTGSSNASSNAAQGNNANTNNSGNTPVYNQPYIYGDQ